MSYICINCQKLVDVQGNFCPYCGNQNIKNLLSISTGEKFKIYTLSFLFAPLGLYWFFKYLRSPDKEKRKAGNIALLITLLALASATITTKLIFSEFIEIYKPTLELYSELN